VLRRFDLGCRPTAGVLIVDLDHLFARRLVAGLRLCGRLGFDWLSLTAAHTPNRTPAGSQGRLSRTCTSPSVKVTSTSPARNRIPSSSRVATIGPSKTSSANCSRPFPLIRTTAPPGLRQTPLPAALNPLVWSSPSSSGVGGGGTTVGRLIGLDGGPAVLGAGLRNRACSRESRSSSEPSSCSKKADEMRLASRERRMQFAQSASVSTRA